MTGIELVLAFGLITETKPRAQSSMFMIIDNGLISIILVHDVQSVFFAEQFYMWYVSGENNFNGMPMYSSFVNQMYDSRMSFSKRDGHLKAK